LIIILKKYNLCKNKYFDLCKGTRCIGGEFFIIHLYHIIDHLAIALGYNIFKIDVETDYPGEIEGRVDYFHNWHAIYILVIF